MSEATASPPVQGENETNLEFGLRAAAWRRAERKRKREARNAEPADSPAEPEETREESIKDAWTKSERYLKEQGE